ncbi:putative ABC transport system ATP-binding protein [Streptosporangium album]|uniref:Putative ABC transport system ATP-binding protein n=1 Tax=Streptosporangium album TaxID=47479 RepID=A0A7W7W7W7_9ACTN|nr:ABC transporter ATP-binding protein [Streptosporangium album]MBB4937722.1 putative ABC transport system ATP-binding protein [Streptosporangium album]
MEELHKTYGKMAALAGVTLEIADGEFVAMMGPSGSGKSTLLHCAAGLDTPSSGRVFLGGVEVTALDEPGLAALRRERIGFVFQAYNLLQALDVADNITLPLRLAGRPVDEAKLMAIAARVGLGSRLGHRPAELSGGQQQRVALARALITDPEVVFADEPTGALDTRTAREVLTLLRELVDEAGQTLVMVTHDPVAASYAHRVVFLADGHLAGEALRPTPEQVAERMTQLGAS